MDGVDSSGGGGGGDEGEFGVLDIPRLAYDPAPARNPYLGGFRDTRTGIEYLHMYTQTDDLRPPKPPRAQQFTRETQTTVVSTRSCQTYREAVAQTRRSGLHEDTSHDVVLVARTYFTAAELAAVREAKALEVQCVWRGFCARRRAAERRGKLGADRAAADKAAEEQRVADEAKLARDAERRLNPRTLEDFSILYDEVEAWRLAETERIKREYASASSIAGGGDAAGASRAQKAALAALLAKETALISTIERLRASAGAVNRDAAIEGLLSGLAAPKVWALSGGADPATVHTPLSTRAAELKALYDELCAHEASDRDARTETLLSVKYTVLEFDSALTREVAELVDREVDLLGRGRPAAALTGLRKRLRSLFLTFCTTPEFNPAAGLGSARTHPLVQTAAAVAAAAAGGISSSSAPSAASRRRAVGSAGSARAATAAAPDVAAAGAPPPSAVRTTALSTSTAAATAYARGVSGGPGVSSRGGTSGGRGVPRPASTFTPPPGTAASGSMA